jgi:hypothetical protein
MMDERDVERLLNLVRTELIGASDAGIKGQLYDVCREFFKDSNSWYEIISVPILSGHRHYRITPRDGGMILRLATIWDNNHITMPAIMPHLDPPSAELELVYPQNVNMTARAIVTKQIVEPTTQDMLPDAPRWLLPVYHETILDGVLGKMMAQTTKSYSNDTQAVYHLRRFRDGCMQARVASERANLYGGQAWRFPNTFRTSSQRGGVSTPFPSPTSW